MNRSAAAATIFSRRVGRAPALDEPAVGRDLVGAVDRQIETVERVERLDMDAELACSGLGTRRRRDAAQRQPAPRERGEEVRDRRAGSQAHGHPVFDELCRSLGSQLLLAPDAHRGIVSRSPPVMHSACVTNGPDARLRFTSSSERSRYRL